MTFVLVIHVIVCILLVITILMQSGRGGGLTETFQSAESMFGTQTNSLMVRITTILATIFLCTSLFLAYSSSKGNKSLMANRNLMSEVPKSATPVQPKVSDVKVNGAAPVAATTTTSAPATASSTSESKDVPVNPVTNATK